MVDSDLFLFIAGPPRTGTTLLLNILNNHPEIWLSNETHFCEELLPRLDGFRRSSPAEIVNQLGKIHSSYAGPPSNELRPVSTFDAERFRTWLERTGRCSTSDVLRKYLRCCAPDPDHEGYTGEKTPRHIFHVDSIRERFPGARFLITLRDGRDYLASYKYAWKKKEDPSTRKRLKALYNPLLTSLNWHRNWARVQEVRSDSDVMIVPYEKLVRRPGETLQRAFSFLDLSYEESCLNVVMDNSSYSTSETERSTLRTSSIGRWKEKLTPAEVYIFETINRSFFQKERYARSRMPSKSFDLIREVLKLPYSALKALYANRKQIPGLGRFLRSRF